MLASPWPKPKALGFDQQSTALLPTHDSFLIFLQNRDFYDSADTSMHKHTGAEPLPRNQLEYLRGMCPSGVHALGSDTKNFKPVSL